MKKMQFTLNSPIRSNSLQQIFAPFVDTAITVAPSLMHLLLSLPSPWIGASGNPQTLAASAGSSAEPQHQLSRPPHISTCQCSVCISQKMIWANTTPAAAVRCNLSQHTFPPFCCDWRGWMCCHHHGQGKGEGPGPGAESWHSCSSTALESRQTDFLHSHPPPVLAHPVSSLTFHRCHCHCHYRCRCYSRP